MDEIPAKDGLNVAERMAWEFINGLGIDPDGLEYRRLGTPAEQYDITLGRQPPARPSFIERIRSWLP